MRRAISKRTVNTYHFIAEELNEGDLKNSYYQRAAAEYHKAGKIEAEADFFAKIGRTYVSQARLGTTSQAQRVLYYDKVISYMSQALRLYQQLGKQQDASLYQSLGLAYSNSGRYDEALAAYQSALSISISTGGDVRSVVRGHYNVGRTHELKGDKDAAKKSYEEVIRLESQSDTVIFTYKRNAEAGLKRLRGELAPLNAPKPEPSPKAEPSPSPAASVFNVLWFGILLRTLLV